MWVRRRRRGLKMLAWTEVSELMYFTHMFSCSHVFIMTSLMKHHYSELFIILLFPWCFIELTIIIYYLSREFIIIQFLVFLLVLPRFLDLWWTLDAVEVSPLGECRQSLVEGILPAHIDTRSASCCWEPHVHTHIGKYWHIQTQANIIPIIYRHTDAHKSNTRIHNHT